MYNIPSPVPGHLSVQYPSPFHSIPGHLSVQYPSPFHSRTPVCAVSHSIPFQDTCLHSLLFLYSSIFREVGTIIRSLGCNPSEAELSDMLTEVEEEEPTGFVRLEKFQPMMARVLLEKRYLCTTYTYSRTFPLKKVLKIYHLM